MMSKLKQKGVLRAQISTASLPDIVFLLLFFFMVTATLENEDKLVTQQLPKAKTLNKAGRKILVKTLEIGYPLDRRLGQGPRIVAKGQFLEVDQIAQWIEHERAEMPERYRDQMIVVLKADEEVEMGVVADVQEQLRATNARKILYRAWNEAK